MTEGADKGPAYSSAEEYADLVVPSGDPHRNRLCDLAEPDGSNDVILASSPQVQTVKAQRADLHWIIAEAFRAGLRSAEKR